MKIPKSFQLQGRTYTVHIVPKDQWPEPDATAYFEPEHDRICIKRTRRELMEHALFHEMLHACLLALGRDKLFNDEAFVDGLGGLLHQAFKSAT